MLRLGALLLVLTLFASAAFANVGTDAQLRDIDRFIARTLRTLPELPALGVAVARDGKSYARGYGYADVARRIRADAQTGFYNGSNTKAYTAVLCTMLAAEGVLDLDAPVTKYLPELHFAPPIDPAQTTLRRFLSHTSGIENSAVVFRTAYSGEHTSKDLVRILSLSTPGKGGFRYDNLGYVVASLVVERVTGKKWQEVLDQRLFEPLGMHRTTAYMSEARRHRIASPYDMNDAGQMSFLEYGWKVDSTMHAAGGIVTTPADLAKWLEASLTQGRIGGRQVLPAAAFAEAQRQQTPAKRDSFLFNSSGYGFGWYQSDLHGEKAIYHGGGYEGWRSIFSFLPEKGIAVGVMTNAGLSHSPLELVSGYIYDRLANRPDVEEFYAAKLAEIRTRFDKVKKDHIADAQNRAQRQWKLQHPLSAYAGRYEHPMFGTLTIALRGDKLVASLGRLSGALQPFTEAESARVELVPGSGEVLRFQFSQEAQPDAVKWGDEVMTRQR
jgi:CubicO group peptidase (beta-lactamase class C family)